MLDVKRNRLDYGRLLIPPEGHRLTQAIATAYSVDLDTLLSIPVALYYAQTLEGQLEGKDVQVIRAIPARLWPGSPIWLTTLRMVCRSTSCERKRQRLCTAKYN